MRKAKKIISVLIALALVGGIAFFFGTKHSDKENQITEKLLASYIEESRDLITTKYHYTNMGSFSNKKDFYGYKIPLTQKKFIVSYDGVMLAGIDLKDLKIEVSGDKINVDVPKSKILADDIDEKSIKVFDESASVFNPIEVSDYVGFAKDQQKKMQEKAINNGILEEADKNTEKAIKEILKLNPKVEDKYTVEVHQIEDENSKADKK